MDRKLKLPIGIDNFEKIRKENFYYVDKTKLIEQLLERWGEVNLFTRPRRFGKTLNMSMLKYFFEIGTDQTLFDGLYISDNQQLKRRIHGKISSHISFFKRSRRPYVRKCKISIDAASWKGS